MMLILLRKRTGLSGSPLLQRQKWIPVAWAHPFVPAKAGAGMSGLFQSASIRFYLDGLQGLVP